MVSNFEYANGQIIKSSHLQYLDAKKIKTEIKESENTPHLDDPEMALFLTVDTLRNFFVKYSYNEIGLLKEKKTYGRQRNTNTFKKEMIDKIIQYEYDFVSENPLKLITTKSIFDIHKEEKKYIIETTFNREGFPAQIKYLGPSVLDPEAFKITNFTYEFD